MYDNDELGLFISVGSHNAVFFIIFYICKGNLKKIFQLITECANYLCLAMQTA